MSIYSSCPHANHAFPPNTGQNEQTIPLLVHEEVSNSLLLTSDSLGILVPSVVQSVGRVVLV